MAGKFFNALGKAGVNIRAIAQGSSERNISAVIEQHEATKALRALHSAFYLSSQTLSIGVIGTGLIGSTFLDQLSSRIEELSTRAGHRLAGAWHHEQPQDDPSRPAACPGALA